MTNPALSDAIASLNHMESMVIADSDLPLPTNINVIDSSDENSNQNLVGAFLKG
ncbi:MAG TPA: RbsD/FucU domain-containing protein [Ruminiclostridium sp.]